MAVSKEEEEEAHQEEQRYWISTYINPNPKYEHILL